MGPRPTNVKLREWRLRGAIESTAFRMSEPYFSVVHARALRIVTNIIILLSYLEEVNGGKSTEKLRSSGTWDALDKPPLPP